MVAAARNLGLVMRKLFGIGKPRCLQGGCLLAYFLHPTRHAFEFALSGSRLFKLAISSLSAKVYPTTAAI